MDKYIFLSGFARSGTSWLGKIFHAHPGVFYHFEPFDLVSQRKGLDPGLRFWSLLPRLKDLVSQGQIEQAIRDFSRPLDRFYLVRDHSLDRPPYFDQNGEVMAIKEDFSYLPEVVTAFGPMVQIIRDPRGLLNSLWNHTRFGAHYGAQSTAQRWAERNSYILRLSEKNPDRVMVVRYEDLVSDPIGTSKRLIEWTGLDWDPAVARFVTESHSRHEGDHYAVWKDPARVSNAWKTELSPAIQELVLRTVRGSHVSKKLYNDFKI